MGTTITFIQHPPYIVDFRQFGAAEPAIQPELNLPQRVQLIGALALAAIRFFSLALGRSIHTTLSNAGVSFKHIVLGYYGDLANFRPPGDIYLAVFRIVLWMLAMGANVVMTTFRRCMDEMYPVSLATAALSEFVASGINVHHIRTNEVVLDASGVPPDVTVDDLMTMLNETNFDNPNLPGYMPPSTRQEGYTVYSVEELRARLRVFMNNVNRRVAFLGTPPAYDTPRLMAFYQQIDDALRIAIHKANQDIATFRLEHPGAVDSYEVRTRNHYNDLLQVRSGIAITMAIAGRYCGGRYLGETMGIYQRSRSDYVTDADTLRHGLEGVLARKRAEIAAQETQIRLGNDTHAVGTYLQELGPRLGIPGSQNVIEHIPVFMNVHACLVGFFEKYTVDVIIDTVQQAVNTSQALREKIIGWVGDQVGEWQRDKYERLATARAEAVRRIVSSEGGVNPCVIERIQIFERLLVYLKSQGALVVRGEEISFNGEATNIGDLVGVVCESEQAKTWFRDQFPEEDNVELFTETDCSQEWLEEDWEALVLRDVAIDAEGIRRRLLDSACSKADETLANIEGFAALLAQLRDRGCLPALEGRAWSDFMDDVFALEDTKGWCRERFSGLDRLAKIRKVQEMKTEFSEMALRGFWEGVIVRRDVLDREQVRQILLTLRRAKAINRETGLDQDVIQRVFRAEVEWSRVIHDRLDRTRRGEFVAALGMENIATDGLSPEMMEWLLVSQGILKPQHVGMFS